MSGARRERIADSISTFCFYSLVVLIALVAIPYGGVEPWWKALFQCGTFLLAALTTVQRLVIKKSARTHYRLLLPVAALLTFAFIQTIPWSHRTIGGVENIPQTISADASQTRLFVVQVLALALAGGMLVSHTTTRARQRFLVEALIAIGTLSALYGLLRQAGQNHSGFFLPYLRPQYGYAQFINRDHFAFMIEMVLALTLGVLVISEITKKRFVIYVVAAVPMWVALVLSNSRGGIFSMLCQVFILSYFLGQRLTKRNDEKLTERPTHRWWWRGRSLAVRVALMSIFLAAAVVAVIVIGGDPLLRKLDATAIELDPKTAGSYTLRLNIWQATWALIKDHPIAGAGFGGYWMAVSKYHRATGEITPQQAHSDYLEIVASGGLIAVGLAFWFLAAFVRAVRKHLRSAGAYNRAVSFSALIGIVTVGVHSLVDFGIHVPINSLLLTTLVALTLMNISERPVVATGGGAFDK